MLLGTVQGPSWSWCLRVSELQPSSCPLWGVPEGLCCFNAPTPCSELCADTRVVIRSHACDGQGAITISRDRKLSPMFSCLDVPCGILIHFSLQLKGRYHASPNMWGHYRGSSFSDQRWLHFLGRSCAGTEVTSNSSSLSRITLSNDQLRIWWWNDKICEAVFIRSV